MTWKNTFQKRINELWDTAKDEDHRITQEDYAKRLGVTRNSLLGWMRGAGQPDADGFVRIAQIENVTLEWLLGDNRKFDDVSLLQDDLTIIRKYKSLSEAHKNDIRVFVDHYYEQDCPQMRRASSKKRERLYA